ncbi:hypothetical protein GCM10017687_51790 [Streptomyces echinatus]
MTDTQGGLRGWTAGRKGSLSRLRFTSLRLRLVLVFALVALTAAVSASGIAYWLNREAVLTRTQDAVLRDFRQEMQNRAGALPAHPSQDQLQRAAGQMAASSQRFSVLLVGQDADGGTVYGNSGGINGFALEDVPESLRAAVNKRQPVSGANKEPYHLYWQRVTDNGAPYLVAGTRVIGGGPTGYMAKSLEPEAKDLNSLAWSLGIATALALIGSALLAQGRRHDRAEAGAPARGGRAPARRGQAGHPAAGVRHRRTCRSVPDVQQRGRGAGAAGRGDGRTGRRVPPVRRRHEP